MASAMDGIRQIVETAHPRTIKRLRAAGAVSPLSPIAIATALPYLVGRGTSLGIVLQMNAITVGKKPAIVDQHGTITWRELDSEVNRFSRALYRAGLKGGDKVALLLRNGREAAIAALAAQRTGIIACPVNTWAKKKELKAVLGSIAPDLLIYDTQHVEQAGAAAPEGLPLVAVGDQANALPDSVSWKSFTEGCSAGPLAPLTRDRGSAKIIIQTSGTTGTPKGAARDSSAAGMGALANLLGTVPYRRDDRVYIPAPLFHSFGLATFTFATALGATMVLPPKFDPEQSLKDIEAHLCTAASFVPVMIRRIVSLDDDIKRKYDMSSLRIVMASGSVL
ncbi:MAG: AMP-binding protein, partial [Actinomycetota bacterium]